MFTPRRRAFSLIEVLVVISIIVLLISMALPSLSTAKEAGRDAKCMSGLRQVAVAFDTFEVEHNGHYPGAYTSVWVGPQTWQKSWMGKETWFGANYEGTIVRYLSGGAPAARELYRCPSLPAGQLGSGSGSNGRFDYTSLLVFSGAKKISVPTTVEVVEPATGERFQKPTPLVVEESPSEHLNGCCIDPGHSNIDRLGQWHFGGAGNYAAVDTHVEKAKFVDAIGPTTWDWFAKTPQGHEVPLTSHSSGFGGWQNR